MSLIKDRGTPLVGTLYTPSNKFNPRKTGKPNADGFILDTQCSKCSGPMNLGNYVVLGGSPFHIECLPEGID